MTILRDITRSEAFGGILLFSAAVLAIIMSNSPAQQLYDQLIHLMVTIQVEDFKLSKPLFLWINDGLMTIFFLLVGLEIKREMCKGVLNHQTKLILPALGAIGGLVVPVIIYSLINAHDATAMKGWAIPAATDIAFSLGILSLLGKRIPVSLKIFLTALAIIDDILAILIIAIFYTGKLSVMSLVFSVAMIFILFAFNQLGVKRLAPYFLVGYFLWLSVLQSGIHATLTGIILASTIPLDAKDHSPLIKTENFLLPWVTYCVLPLFAFANTGFSFKGLSFHSLLQPVPLGIAAGLFFGKQIGIFSTCWLLVKAGVAKLPKDLNWRQVYGMSLLCGVGFTMSLFIGSMAFQLEHPEFSRMLRLGVLTGSILSGIAGYLMLRMSHDTKST